MNFSKINTVESVAAISPDEIDYATRNLQKHLNNLTKSEPIKTFDPIKTDVKEIFNECQSGEINLPYFKPNVGKQFHAGIPEFSSDRLSDLVDDTSKTARFVS